MLSVSWVKKFILTVVLSGLPEEKGMTTVAQMIEWLKTLPQDAEVECGFEESDCDGRYMVHRPVDIEGSDVFDYKDEMYKDYPHVYGKVIVQICGE
jgi:hypothetical protein